MVREGSSGPARAFPLVCAHRGLSACCPENTLPSFGAALGTGAAEIEFDLRLTSDGVPIVFHDGDLGRATGRFGLVQDASWEDIRRLDASQGRDPCWRGVGIPSLEQVLDLVGGRVVLNIHCKDPGPEDRLVEAAVRILRARDLERSAYVAGKEAVLAAARRIAPDLPRACLDRQAEPARQIEMASRYGCARVQLRTVAAAEDVAEAHARGLVCNLFFADEAEEARSWVRRGIDVVLTNAAHRITAELLRS
jgi:glycerophosphoryl diester phosphodiesterase